MSLEDAYRAAARQHHVDGELEIDDNAVVSMGCDHGAYVQAWIWIDDRELDPADRPLTCGVCGESMFCDETGVSYHGSPDEIDHTLDADHVPFKETTDD